MLCPRCLQVETEPHPLYGAINCQKCIEKDKDIPRGPVKNDFLSSNGELHSKTHNKDIQTRVITHEGENLSGKAGLNYMKKNPDKYVGQLKGYYNA